MSDTPQEKAEHRSLSNRWSNGKTQMRRVVLLVVVVYLIAFAALNSRRVKIDFVFFSVRTMLLVALAVAAVLCFAIGYLSGGRRAKQR